MTTATRSRPNKVTRRGKTYTRGRSGQYTSGDGSILDGADLIEAIAEAGDTSTERSGGISIGSGIGGADISAPSNDSSSSGDGGGGGGGD